MHICHTIDKSGWEIKKGISYLIPFLGFKNFRFYLVTITGTER